MCKAYQDKVVFITGASSGIGAALAHEWARRGAHVVLTARRIDRLSTLATELTQTYGIRALALECDVTKPDDLNKCVRQSVQAFGRIDVAVANAGFGVIGSFEKLTLEDYRRQFDTNIDGVIRTAQAVIPELKKTQGRLLITGSVMGYIATPQASPYAMSKFAVRALAESLYYELKPQGVKVYYVAPGFVESEIYQVNNKGQRIGSSKDGVPSWLRMSAPRAAREIVRRSLRCNKEIVITGHGKVIVFFQRHMPWLITWIMCRFVRRHRPEAAPSTP